MTRDGEWGGDFPQHGGQQTGMPGSRQPHDAPPANQTAGASQIESLLHSLVQRLDENDKRYNAAIGGIEERLSTLSSRAGQAGAGDQGTTADTLSRVGAQAADLAQQIRRSEHAQRQQQPDSSFRTIEDRISDFAESIQQGGPDHQPEPDPHLDPQQPPPMSDSFGERFTNAAAGFEQTLAEGRPTQGLEELNARVDDLVQNFDTALANSSDKAALQSIEAQLNNLAAQFTQAQQQYSRVDAIEANLVRVMEWTQSAESQIEAAARKAAQETALSMEGASGAVTDRLDTVQRELQALNARARDIDDRTVGTLESMNSALRSLAGQLTTAAGERAAEANQPDAPVQTYAVGGEIPAAEPDFRADEPLRPEPIDKPAPAPRLAPDASRSHIGASIPDYQEMPHTPGQNEYDAGAAGFEQPAAKPRVARDTMLDDDDFLASARRAAAAASRSAHAPERKSLFSAFRRKKEAQPPAPQEGGNRRPILFVAAVLLLTASAAMLYGKLKSQTSDVPVAVPLPQTETLPPRTSQKKDDSKLPAGQAITPRASTRRAPLAIEPPAVVPQYTTRGNTAEAATDAADPKLASLSELPVEPGYPGLAVTIVEPAQPAQTRTAPEAPIPAPPAARPVKVPLPDAAPAAVAKPEPRPAATQPSAPMPPAKIGPQSLRLAAARGNPQAQFETATRYAKGSGVKQNFKKAAEWYARAAARGLAPAQYRLAALYERGRGVTQDTALARVWYERAATQGNVKAMHNLAVFFTGGQGRKADHAMAAKWFTEAARFGLADSQFNLGILYEAGLGVPKSPLEAYQWFSLAAARGDKAAADHRQRVRLQLNRDMIRRADRTVKLWRARPVDQAANTVRAPKGGWRAAAKGGPSGDRTLVLRAQALLNKLGYNAGVPDGVAGPQTVTAVRRFESRSGRTATGKISPELIERLEALSG